MKKKYIIGIDFGHGETSAAYCKIPENGRAPEEVKDIKIAKGSEANQYTIPSSIFIPTKNDINPVQIGGDAFGRKYLGHGIIYVGFKQKPQIPPPNIEIEEETAMWKFMKEVNTKILNDPSLPFRKDNYYIYIAKPSSWGKKAKMRFFKLAHDQNYAGLPIKEANAIINESRAAFIYAQRDATNRFGRKIYEGTVVIDMGSSTVDMTYMSEISNSFTMKDQGFYCGAAMIEESMLKEEMEKNDNLAHILNCNPDYKYPLLYEYRKIKEKYFRGEKYPITIYLEETINPNITEKIRVSLNKKNIDEYTKEYQINFRESLNKYKNYLSTELKREVTINFVILTGGASRMPFAKRIISEEWKLNSKEQIYQIEDPSLTVSRGVAEVARLDILSKEKKYEIKEKVKCYLSEETIKYKIIPEFLIIVCKHLKDKCVEIIRENKSATLSWIESEMKDFCNQNLDDIGKMTSYLSDAIEESSKDIRKDIEQLVSYYTGLGLEMGGLTKNIIIQISQFNSDLLKEIEKHIEEIRIAIGKEINKPGLFKKIWRSIYETIFETRKEKEKREENERWNNKLKGGQYPLTDEKRETLIQDITKTFDNAAKKKYPIAKGAVESVKNYADCYIKQLINNIDLVRREITDNEE